MQHCGNSSPLTENSLYHPDMNKSPGSEDKLKEISVAYVVLFLLLYTFHCSTQNSSFNSDSYTLFQLTQPLCRFYQTMKRDLCMTALVSLVYRDSMMDLISIHRGYDLSLSFEESIFRGQKNIEVSCFETCDHCNGSGAKSSSCVKSCVDCGGRGGVMKSQRTPFGVMSQVTYESCNMQIFLVYFFRKDAEVCSCGPITETGLSCAK
ncbi:hypothetical protein IFM89_023594 [Coptis chinensis]|uniref:Uncharacterized protein n=1 Tax=Coptis chinensis TaxID=261450 RepID=A0A835HGS2_9MAGN|nr:hypothetical protein IFM89_023594 [Coptis chinensis]